MSFLRLLARRAQDATTDWHIRAAAAAQPDQRAAQLAVLEAIYRRPAATRRNTRKENQR
ncbi:hypothetical protein [Streptomyces axinellae]|uniref:Uncharacterized protein n=1 Tax=Streptomyces axinellae TaxID=552788 RepID=A0ABN3QMA2_9ACTN